MLVVVNALTFVIDIFQTVQRRNSRSQKRIPWYRVVYTIDRLDFNEMYNHEEEWVDEPGSFAKSAPSWLFNLDVKTHPCSGL